MMKRMMFVLLLFLGAGWVENAHGGQVTLAWDANTEPDVAGYKLWIGLSPGVYGPPNFVDVGNVTTFTITELTNGVTYNFVCTAYDTWGNESGYSNEVSVTISSDGSVGEIITVSITLTLLPQSKLSVYSVDTYQPGYEGSKAIDGNPATAWCYAFNPVTLRTPHPHHIMLDLGSSHLVGGFQYLPRQDGSLYGTITQYQLFVSDDPNNLGAAVSTGTWAGNSSLKEIVFTAKVGRYVKLVSLADAMGSVAAMAAEVNVLVQVGGSIDPPGLVFVPVHGNQFFTITPDPGYDIADVLTDDVSQGPVTQFEFTDVTTTHSISTFFTLKKFTVSATAGPGGTISGNGTVVDYGDTLIININPDPGKIIQDVTLNGVSKGAVSLLNIASITSAPVVTATFGLGNYALNIFTPTGGIANPNGTFSAEGNTNQSISYTPPSGHRFSYLTDNGASYNGTLPYQLTNITTDHTIIFYSQPNTADPTTDANGDRIADTKEFYPLAQSRLAIYSANSQQVGYEGYKAIDGRANTFWLTLPGNPHTLILDLGAPTLVGGIEYTPRQDGSLYGTIVSYEIYVSNSPSSWSSPVESGSLTVDASKKKISITPQTGRYLKFVSLADAMSSGLTAIAEIGVLGVSIDLLPQSKLSVYSVDTYQPGYEGSKAIDGNPATAWCYAFNPVTLRTPHPHHIMLDLGSSHLVGGFQYLPRQDGSLYGTITQYQLFVSDDPNNLGAAVSTGTWAGNSSLKEIVFTAKVGRYVKLVSLADAMGSIAAMAAEVKVRAINLDLLPQSKLSVYSVDTYQPGYEGSKAIDGNPATAWCYAFNPVTLRTPHPHHIMLDLGSSHLVGGFQYLPRQDGSLYGTITQYQLFVSDDPNNLGAAVSTGTWAGNSSLKEIAFNAKVGRYVKLVSLADAMGSVGAMAAEVRVMEKFIF